MNGLIGEIKRGDMFWCDFGNENIVGSEQRNKRPVIVLQNNVGNRFSPTIVIAVITSQINKAKLPTHVEIGVDSGLNKESVILLEQIKSIDKRRLLGYIGKANKDVIKRVKDATECSLAVGDKEYNFLSREEKIAVNFARQIIEADGAIHLSETMGADSSLFTQIRALRIRDLAEHCSIYDLDFEDYYKDKKEVVTFGDKYIN